MTACGEFINLGAGIPPRTAASAIASINIKTRPAKIAHANHRMDHRLSNASAPPKQRKIFSISRIFRCDQRIGRDGGHSCVDQRRRIRHSANDFTVVSCARKLIKRYACGDRDHQRVFVQAGEISLSTFTIMPGFTRRKRYPRPGDLLRALRRINAVLIAQGGDFIGEGMSQIWPEVPDRWQSVRQNSLAHSRSQ